MKAKLTESTIALKALTYKPSDSYSCKMKTKENMTGQSKTKSRTEEFILAMSEAKGICERKSRAKNEGQGTYVFQGKRGIKKDG